MNKLFFVLLLCGLAPANAALVYSYSGPALGVSQGTSSSIGDELTRISMRIEFEDGADSDDWLESSEIVSFRMSDGLSTATTWAYNSFDIWLVDGEIHAWDILGLASSAANADDRVTLWSKGSVDIFYPDHSDSTEYYTVPDGVSLGGGFASSLFAPPSVLISYWSVAVVPIPAAVWLFGSGLGLLGWVYRKRA